MNFQQVIPWFDMDMQCPPKTKKEIELKKIKQALSVQVNKSCLVEVNSCCLNNIFYRQTQIYADIFP